MSKRALFCLLLLSGTGCSSGPPPVGGPRGLAERFLGRAFLAHDLPGALTLMRYKDDPISVKSDKEVESKVAACREAVGEAREIVAAFRDVARERDVRQMTSFIFKGTHERGVIYHLVQVDTPGPMLRISQLDCVLSSVELQRRFTNQVDYAPIVDARPISP